MATIPSHERRTGLLIPVAVESLVDGFRARHNAAAVARRLPPHITVLFPFARGTDVAEAHGPELAAHFATFEPFSAQLTGVGQFDGYVWLSPEPRNRFLDLITHTCRRFPAFPPYEGEGGEPEPHLTIAASADADSREAIAALARTELEHLLPFDFFVDGVWLFEEQEDGTFLQSSRFALG